MWVIYLGTHHIVCGICLSTWSRTANSSTLYISEEIWWRNIIFSHAKGNAKTLDDAEKSRNTLGWTFTLFSQDAVLRWSSPFTGNFGYRWPKRSQWKGPESPVVHTHLFEPTKPVRSTVSIFPENNGQSGWRGRMKNFRKPHGTFAFCSIIRPWIISTHSEA